MSKSLEAMTFDSGYAHGHKAGWDQCKKQMIAEWELPWGMSDRRFEERMRGLEYQEPTNEH